MRILMVNHPSAPRFRGGDHVQLRESADALRQLGMRVDESVDRLPNAECYDIAHVFNLRTIPTTGVQVAHLKKQGIPIVLSPIYINPSIGLYANAALKWIFCRHRSEEQIERMLTEFAFHPPKMRVSEFVTYSRDGQNRPVPGYDDAQCRILRMVDGVVANSHAEFLDLQRTLRYVPTCAAVVPYAVNPRFRDHANPQLFRDRYHVDNFILCVGRIEWSKNQLLLAIACRKLGLPLVLIGRCLQPGYAKLCRQHGPDQLLILDHMPQTQLASAYAAALVHALPSWIETCGLSTMEALSLGCPAVVSIVGHEFEHFGGVAHYCDPASVDSIEKALGTAIESPAGKSRAPNSFTSWRDVASMLKQFYEEVLVQPSGVAPADSGHQLRNLGAMVPA